MVERTDQSRPSQTIVINRTNARMVARYSPTVWAVTRSGTDPIVVNLPELDKFAEPTAREYPYA